MIDTLKSLVRKNLKEKYGGSGLGIFWPLLNPLLIMLAASFVFNHIMKAQVRHFPLFILAALLPWYFFVNSLSESATCLKRNLPLLSQFILPPEAIPLSITIANFLIFFFGFLIVLPIFIIANTAVLKYMVALPLIIILQFIFVTGISYLAGITSLYFKDLPQLLNILIMFLFWITPLFYPIEEIPRHLQWVVYLSPGTPFAFIYRDILYYGSFSRLYIWFFAVLFALIFFSGGFWLFKRSRARILKVI